MPTPVALEHPDRQQLMYAMAKARERYPGPISTVLCDYLIAWSEFGYRIAPASIPAKLLEHLLN